VSAPVDSAQAARMASIAALLSLDCVRPLMPAMGLDFVDSHALVACLRELVAAVRARAEAGEVPEDLGRDMLALVKERLGDDAAAGLERWIRHTYWEAHEDQPHWSAWHIAFHFCAYKKGQHDALALPLDRRNDLLDDFVEMLDVGELGAQLESLCDGAASDWDVEVFVRRGWDPADEHDVPRGLVREIARMHRFQLFAAKVVSQLGASQLAATRDAAQRIVERRGVWLPEPLEGLGELVEGLSS
jgi:hypothetical protein